MPFLAKIGRPEGRTKIAAAAPAPTPGVPNYGALKIKLLGDGSVATVANGIQSAFTALGYTGSLTISSQTLNTTYTASVAAADLTTANYDIVIVYTNGGLTLGNVGTPLNNYAAAGGKIISGVFLWNLRLTNFNYNYTPWSSSGVGQSNTGSTSYTNVITHPITNTISTSIGGNPFFINTPMNLNAGATLISRYADNTPFIAVLDTGTNRFVGFNYFPPQTYATFGTLYRLLVRAIGWTMNKI